MVEEQVIIGRLFPSLISYLFDVNRFLFFYIFIQNTPQKTEIS